jgi:peptidoglycan/LPS O-acetylase OafA/YrhL
MASPRSDRDYALEALRGIAAVSVLFWHNMLGFYPERSGLFPGFEPSLALYPRFWFGLIYGSSSVSFFFVLSGFVLTRHLFLTGDPSQIQRNAIKRLPRLAFPVLIVVLLSYLAFRFSLYSYQLAAIYTRSPWLYLFGSATVPPTTPTLVDAVKQGAYRTFFRGDSYFDSSLWTMRYEFFGSFAAFGLALLLKPIERRAMKVYLLALVIGMFHCVDPNYVAFPLGVALAAFMPAKRVTIHPGATVALVLVYVYLSGYAGQTTGAFFPFAWIARIFIPPQYVNMTGALALLFAAETSLWLRGFLSRGWGVFLGRVSFPLYLLHVPVLCSAGCGVFLALVGRYGMPRAQIAGVATTIAVSFALAYPLSRINDWWLTQLNRVVARIAPRPPAPVSIEPELEERPLVPN